MNKSEKNFMKIDKDGIDYYGGNQKWWESSNETISKYGCGVIAMCNLEICLDSKLRDGENNMHGSSEENKAIKYSDYMAFVNKSYEEKYHFVNRAPFDSLGLMPWTMKKGLEVFCKKHKILCTVKWVPTLRKRKILLYIRYMLQNNIPITASYYVFSKRNRLDFYVYDEMEKVMAKRDGCRSHYFNITGIVSIEEENKNTDYFIISSWGRKYYVKVDEWVAKLSYFTNILFVKTIFPSL